MVEHEESLLGESERLKERKDQYKKKLGETLSRELMLIEKLSELEEELKTSKQSNPMLIS
jgi:hypothetical protein